MGKKIGCFFLPGLTPIQPSYNVASECAAAAALLPGGGVSLESPVPGFQGLNS
jgi:hypothetical protein